MSVTIKHSNDRLPRLVLGTTLLFVTLELMRDISHNIDGITSIVKLTTVAVVKPDNYRK